jgi:hypothetical protein
MKDTSPFMTNQLVVVAGWSEVNTKGKRRGEKMGVV